MRFVQVHLLFCSQAWQLIHRLWMLSAFLLWWLLSTHRLTFCFADCYNYFKTLSRADRCKSSPA